LAAVNSIHSTMNRLAVRLLFGDSFRDACHAVQAILIVRSQAFNSAI